MTQGKVLYVCIWSRTGKIHLWHQCPSTAGETCLVCPLDVLGVRTRAFIQWVVSSTTSQTCVWIILLINWICEQLKLQNCEDQLPCPNSLEPTSSSRTPQGRWFLSWSSYPEVTESALSVPQTQKLVRHPCPSEWGPGRRTSPNLEAQDKEQHQISVSKIGNVWLHKGWVTASKCSSAFKVDLGVCLLQMKHPVFIEKINRGSVVNSEFN